MHSAHYVQSGKKPRQGVFSQNYMGIKAKTLAMFVLGAIKAESIVIPRVAEALLAESEAKASSIERRLERFLSNAKINPEETWDELLGQIMPYFRKAPLATGD